MRETPTLAQVVGRRIREARKGHRWSQETLGSYVGRYLERPWPKQVVSKIEAGVREVSASELVALGIVLVRSPSWFLTSPTDVRVRLPSGDDISALELEEVAYGVPVEAGDVEVLVHARQAARAQADELSGLSDQAYEVVERLKAARGRQDGLLSLLGGLFPSEVELRERLEKLERERSGEEGTNPPVTDREHERKEG